MAAVCPWTEQDGVWRRKLGSMETFYLTLASPDGEPVHWMIGCCVSIAYCGNDNVDVEKAVRQAWKDTRRDFPNIAAVVDRGTQEMVVGSDDTAAVEEWLHKSFQVHDGMTADELFSSFKSQLSITLHFLRDANELVIQAPHALIDGRGILYLYHALFTALSKQSENHSNGNLDKGPPNLTKPYDEWLGVSARPSEKNVKDAQSIFQRLMQDKPIRLPGVDFGREPRKAVHRDLGLSEENTRAIIDACKRKRITVTTAWHAALALAVQVSLNLSLLVPRPFLPYLSSSIPFMWPFGGKPGSVTPYSWGIPFPSYHHAQSPNLKSPWPHDLLINTNISTPSRKSSLPPAKKAHRTHNSPPSTSGAGFPLLSPRISTP